MSGNSTMVNPEIEKAFFPFTISEQSDGHLIVVERSVSFKSLFLGFLPFAVVFVFLGLLYVLGYLLLAVCIAFAISALGKRVVHTFHFDPHRITIQRPGFFKSNPTRVLKAPPLVAVRPAPFFVKTWYACVEGVMENGHKEPILSYGGVGEDVALSHSMIMAEAIGIATMLQSVAT